MATTTGPAVPAAPASGSDGATRSRWAWAARLPLRQPWLITLALSMTVELAGVRGPDFPAQQFRTWLFRTHGAWLFDGQWFGGHLLAGYSLLFPPVAAVIGTATVGVLATVASTWLAQRILAGHYQVGRWSRVGLLWWSVITVADLVVGRLTFALGLALAFAAVLAGVRGRRLLATLAALATALASPLAAAFLVMAAVTWTPSAGWRRTLPALGAVAGIGAGALLGGGDGPFPFVWTGLVAILVAVAVGVPICWRRQPTIARFLIVYGALSVVLFAVPNPVGGNMTRLGTLLAGPVAAGVLLAAGRRRTLLLLAGPLLFWQLQPVYGALASSVGDPSAQPGYYVGLLGYLQAHDHPLGRVEIPLTRDHWETVYVAARLPLARGWERQTDIADDGLFYRPGLTASSYHNWLEQQGVRYVALPDVPLDPSSRAEAAMLRQPHPWLVPVWHDTHWQVWRVRHPMPLVTGAGAHLDALGVSSVTLRFARHGTALLRVHYTRFWQVVDGAGCVATSPAGWTEVTAGPGTVTVAARVTLGDLNPLAGAACSR
jgi:hypothetical protein